MSKPWLNHVVGRLVINRSEIRSGDQKNEELLFLSTLTRVVVNANTMTGSRKSKFFLASDERPGVEFQRRKIFAWKFSPIRVTYEGSGQKSG